MSEVEKAPEHRDFEILRKIPINEFGVHFRPIVEGPGGRGRKKVALEHGSAQSAILQFLVMINQTI